MSDHNAENDARQTSMTTFVHGSHPHPRCRCGELARTGVDAAFDSSPTCGDCARSGRF